MKLLASATAIALLTAAPAFAAERSVTLAVDNMTCAMCGPTVKKALTRVGGVGKVEVATDKGTTTVTFDDAKATVAALIVATTNAGYPARLAN
jgi:mercuric ion binding protein